MADAAEGQGSGSGSHMDEVASNLSFTTRTASEPNMTINFRIPGYTAYLDDGTRVEFENKEYDVAVKDVAAYSIHNLLADVANKSKWGTCQDVAFWYWDIEKKGSLKLTTDDDLSVVFQKFQSSKRVSFVVEFPIKPCYKSSMIVEAKLEKLPVRRTPILAPESSGSEKSDDGSGDEENVDPSWMEDEDIFMEDQDVFVDLGLRAEDEAARMNFGHDGPALNATEAEIFVDDVAENEPRFAVDKEHPKIRKGETFPTMEDFQMALKHFGVLNEFQVHKVRTDKKRYRAECKAPGCPWRIVANKLVGQPTVEITMIPHEHECIGSGLVVSSMASKRWVAERIGPWLRKTPNL